MRPFWKGFWKGYEQGYWVAWIMIIGGALVVVALGSSTWRVMVWLT